MADLETRIAQGRGDEPADKVLGGGDAMPMALPLCTDNEGSVVFI